MEPLCCPNCDGGLQLEERADGHWLCCEPCGARVAGPFHDANEIPNYKPVREDSSWNG